MSPQSKSKTKNPEQRTRIITICALAAAILLILGGLIAFQASNFDNSKTEDSTSTTSTNQSTGEADFSVLYALSSQDVLDFMAQGATGFVYAGRPTCPHCQTFAPILTSVVKAEGYPVYYYDTDAASGDSDTKSAALQAINVTAVPTFMFVQNGTIVDTLSDVTSETALRQFFSTYIQ